MLPKHSRECQEPAFSSWGFPQWFHHHGMKMVVKELDLEQKRMVIAASAAFLTISLANIDVFDGWLVQWRVVYSRNEESNGKVFFTSEDLGNAFLCLDYGAQECDAWLIKRFGGTAACQGKYILWKPALCHQGYLNIPCPGTGHDGDPNISIEVDDRIRTAVRKLLAIA